MRYIDYSSTADIFESMTAETLGGASLADIVGGGPAMPLAIHFMEILVEQADLAAHDRVLDIGCGCGRLAAALLLHIGPRGSYRGVDIVPALIDFANLRIASRHSGFSFVTLQQTNPAYDGLRHGGVSPTITVLEDACSPESVDLCLATSLFTHLDSDMARKTLKAIKYALAPDGRALISLFLIDEGVRAIIRKGGAAFRFEHEYGIGTYVEDPSAPLHALAFTFEGFVRLLSEHELYIERVLYGRWPGRPHHVSGQDILLVRRIPPVSGVSSGTVP